jgi:hypothetical protein
MVFIDENGLVGWYTRGLRGGPVRSNLAGSLVVADREASATSLERQAVASGCGL